MVRLFRRSEWETCFTVLFCMVKRLMTFTIILSAIYRCFDCNSFLNVINPPYFLFLQQCIDETGFWKNTTWLFLRRFWEKARHKCLKCQSKDVTEQKNDKNGWYNKLNKKGSKGRFNFPADQIYRVCCNYPYMKLKLNLNCWKFVVMYFLRWKFCGTITIGVMEV